MIDWRGDQEPQVINPDNSSIDSGPSRCKEGFARSAMRAFREGDGEIFGDLVGTTDENLKRLLWDAPAETTLRNIAQGTLDVAPSLLSVVPGALAHAASNVSFEQSAELTKTLLYSMFIESIVTTKRMTVDGWHGSRSLIAAARRGDCVTFGRTLRNGANNAPEMTLALLDVVPMAGRAMQLGKKATRLAKAERLARRASRLTRTARNLERGTVRSAATGAMVGQRATAKVVHGTQHLDPGSTRRIRNAGALENEQRRAAGTATRTVATNFGANGPATMATTMAGTLLPLPFAHAARHIVGTGAVAWEGARTAFHGASDALGESVSKITRSLAQSFDDRWSRATTTHVNAQTLASSIRHRSDWLPSEGAAFFAAVRTPDEIRRRWRYLATAPTQFLLGVWDLAQANKVSIDHLLQQLDQLARIRSNLRERMLDSDFAEPLWFNHGRYLRERQSADAASTLQQLLRGEADELQPTDFPVPPLEFWVGRTDWTVAGRDLRELDPDAFEILQKASERMVRSGRELSVAFSLSDTSEPALDGSYLVQKAKSHGEVVRQVEHARQRFDNAAHSWSIANAVRTKDASFAVRSELLELTAQQPIAVHRVDAAGNAQVLPHGSVSEMILRTSLAEQAEAESILHGESRSFLTEFAAKGMRIEVYGSGSNKADDIDSFARYVTWIDNEQKVLYFVEVNPLTQDFAPFPAMPFATLALPADGPPAVHATILQGLPSSEAEQTVFDFHQIIGEWRTQQAP